MNVPSDYVWAREIREQPAAPDREPLLPCPYCGEKESDGNLELDDHGDEPPMYIRCLWCGTMGPHSLADGDEPPENQTEQQARAAWNKRAESAAPWIPVGSPAKNGRYHVYMKEWPDEVPQADFRDGRWFSVGEAFEYGESFGITHYRPLPPPPAADK